jgi:hypothetical protein
MAGIVITIIPSDTEVRAAAALAAAAHLHLITDGQRTCLSPVVPAGWTRLAVHLKQPEERPHEPR